MIHLGGRYCLSTTSGTVVALCTSGVFSISTLAVYNFPCDVSFVGMKASVATCPERLVVSLPWFSTSTICFVQWDTSSEDLTPLQFHHESLTIHPPVENNRPLIINGTSRHNRLYTLF